jgi:hypothetical protein
MRPTASPRRSRLLQPPALVALAALALVAVLIPASAPAKKHKHRAKHRGTKLIASDTSVNPNPDPFWGRSYCANEERVQQVTTGGDTHATATGAPQGDTAFRRFTVLDGDDSFGERCELGWDSRRSPTAFYRQGRHRITQISIRLPSSFPLDAYTWQAVMQMKQSGPAANSGGAPVLSFDAWGGRWRLRQSLTRTTGTDLRELWSAPAQLNFWTRFIFDVRYSDRKKRGYIRVGADLNGDGDVADPGELSPGFRTYTLKIETPGGEADGIKAGRPIPSHLRAGIYHDSDVPCLAPTGCQVDIDNVQVLRP